jgi:hypothetical protein
MAEMKRTTPRIRRKQPEHTWKRTWQNISEKHLTTTIRAMGFRAVHDIIPTNERLYRIRLSDIPMCRTCNQTDTTLHHVMSCMGARDVWHWTRFRNAIMLRPDPRNVPFTWLLFPTLHIWPAPRHNAIIWLLCHEVYFSLREHPKQNSEEIWKTKRKKFFGRVKVGNSADL